MYVISKVQESDYQQVLGHQESFSTLLILYILQFHIYTKDISQNAENNSQKILTTLKLKLITMIDFIFERYKIFLFFHIKCNSKILQTFHPKCLYPIFSGSLATTQNHVLLFLYLNHCTRFLIDLPDSKNFSNYCSKIFECCDLQTVVTTAKH